MKRLKKENFIKAFIIFSMLILFIQVGHSFVLNFEKEEKIIGNSNRYSFFNIVKPSKETINKIKNFKNILPINIEENNIADVINDKNDDFNINNIINSIFKRDAK